MTPLPGNFSELDAQFQRVVALSELPATLTPMRSTSPVRQVSWVEPPVAWDRARTESSLGMGIPPELAWLWDRASRIHLFEDVTYGQWGLRFWSPEDVVQGIDRVRQAAPDGVLPPDTIPIGKFVGDPQYLLMTAPPSSPSVRLFGEETRTFNEYVSFGPSLANFLANYLDAGGAWFWETPPYTFVR